MALCVAQAQVSELKVSLEMAQSQHAGCASRQRTLESELALVQQRARQLATEVSEPKRSFA